MSRRRHSKPEQGLSPGRLILATGVLSLVFSAGLIAGQRIMLEDSLPPLISVGQPALASQRVATNVEAPPSPGAEDDKSSPRDAIFSFYESLTRPEARPLVTRKAAPEPAPAPVVKETPKPEPAAPAAAQTAPEQPSKEVQAAPAPAAPSAPSEPAPAPAVAPPTEAAPADAPANDEVEAARYTLQVASHPTMERARAEMDKLSAQGLEPHVLAADIPGQGKFYRVRIGKFATIEQARAHQAQLERTREVRTFVTPL